MMAAGSTAGRFVQLGPFLIDRTSGQVKRNGQLIHLTEQPTHLPASGGFRSVLAVSSFRLRVRLDVSIPSAFPAHSEATNPASWIWRPSFERQRDFNPPEQRAAQCTLSVSRRFGS
jgi:hypothetical protein